jgi:O-acetyl-ADP-ribose deacetylase (regulator of RNase III)
MMSIERGRGDLLEAKVDALVNPVNTVGVMGKGLALEFKRAFPDNFRAYAAACKRGEVVIGRMHVTQRLSPPRFIINFPTKDHWRSPSKLDYVRAGLVDLVAQIRSLEIESVAMPALGCGLGQLAWDEVKPLIHEALGGLNGVRVLLFEPSL